MTPTELFGSRATTSGAAPGAASTAPTIIDVRWRLGGPPARADYEAGHVPGAAFIDLDAELCGPPGAGGRHPLPEIASLQAALRRAGVWSERPVVAYDYSDGLAAARLWWTLRWAGHPDVRVLDGGFAAWTAAGLPVETGSAPVQRGDFVVRPGNAPVLDADSAASLARTGVLIDARIGPRYRGETEPIDTVAGHIPGAVNVPYADLVQPDGRLRSASELRERFSLTAGTTVGGYCGSGVTAAHTMLALHEAGVEGAALYVGSWSNWITDPARPIATGDEPAREAS
jgi:thiosulfate/3-mercaptopyruvate sulfurtransferase